MRGRRAGRGQSAAGCVLAGVLVAAALGTAVTGCTVVGPPATTRHSTANPQKTLPRATCGDASTHSLSDGTRILTADKGALMCFAAAARRCASASIAITEMGVDTGTNYVFAIDHGRTACQATELSQSYSANSGRTDGAVDSVPCRLAAVTGAGVTLSCADRDVLVPVRVTQL